jgi:hypothetical protein
MADFDETKVNFLLPDDRQTGESAAAAVEIVVEESL